MKLVFLITWLVHALLLSSADSSEEMETDMARIFDTMSEKMLSSLTKSLSLPLDRQKRELGVKRSLVDDSGVYRLVSVKPVSRLCYPAIRTLFIDVSNTTYAVCITALTDSPSEVVVGYYKEHTWLPIHRWFVNNAVDVAAFYFKNHIYVLVADNEKDSGTDLVRINLKTNARVKDHEVNSNYATSIAIWKMKTNGLLNLAIANSGGVKDAADLSTQVFIYEWKGTYFDQYASFRGSDVKDIEPFHIHGVAYMAVANFRTGKHRPRADSEIFRYDLDKGRWISHQKMATYGAMDWEFFSLGTGLGQEFFLAVANKGNGELDAKSMIYKFVEDKFVPFQCLPTTRATSFASFSTGGRFLLAVANENDAVHLYQYDGWRFVKSGVQSTGEAMSDGAVHLEFHEVMRNMEDVLILSVSNPKHPLYRSVFEVSFYHENLLEDWHRSSTEWCLNTLSKLESKDLDKTLDFSDVIFTDQPSITITGDVVFEKGFVADTLKTPRLKEMSTQEVFDNELLNKLVSLQKRLDVIKQKLEGFSDVLKKSLKIEGNQTIQSNLEFQDAVFSCKDRACHFGNIHTEFLNTERIADWENRLVFTDGGFINGTLMAKDINAPSIHVFGFIDGVKSEDLVTKSGVHSITGHKTFSSLISAQDLQVSGKVDGITISPSTVLLSTGHQTIRGNVKFQNINTTWLRANYVNKRNLTEFYNDLVLTDKSYTIVGEKTFSDVTVNELILTPGSTINGVDLVDLWKSALWKDGFQEIRAEMSFSDVVFDKNLDVSLGINGIQIPGDQVVDITEPAIITASKVFQNSTYIGNLEVIEALNGVPVLLAPDGSRQLDMILKTSNQVITGAKTFHTIHLDADSDVKGYVDGVDLSELETLVLRKHESGITNGTWVFQSLVIKGPLAVGGKISGVNLDDVYRRALKLNESVISEIVFKGDVHVEDLQSNSINNINIRKDFVLVNESQTITGKKTFVETVLEENSLVLGLVNNMNFSFLNEVLLVVGSQHIKSKQFKRDVIMQNLTVENTINGVPVQDIVSLTGGKIFSPRLLQGVTFSRIEAKNVEVTGRVNNIDLKEMIEDTMTYDDTQEVTGAKNVKGTIHVLDGSNLQTNDLNGQDLHSLWLDAVFIDVPQEISGVITFKDNVVFDQLSFAGTIDGVSDWEMKNNWMLKNKPQTVEGNIVFENGFTAKDLNVQTVNGFDLKQLESDIVKVNEASEILGPIIFEKSVVSKGNVGLTGKIQGVDLSEEAVTRNNLYVTGEKKFSQDVVVKDLNVGGLVNGIDIEDLCNKTFLRTDEITLTRLVIKGDVSIEEGTVDGSLDGIDLSLLKDAAVRNDGSKIEFSGLKTFTNITFDGPVTLQGKLGNVDLKELGANYMSKSKYQEIPAKMTFDDLEFKGDLSVTNLNTANGEINNIDLADLNRRILKTSQTQTVTATYYIDEVMFESDVLVDGKINGLELPSGVMRRNHTNYIQSPKIFQQPVVVYGDLGIEDGKTIQSVDISDWFQRAVLKEGEFQIHGYKTFNELYLNDVKVEGRLDTLKISEDSLLMVYGNQIITGRKVVDGSVNIEGALRVNGLINMINISELANAAVRKNQNNTITGLKSFSQPLTTVSLEAPTVAGVDVLVLQKKLNTSLDLSQLENRLEEIEGVVSHMKVAFDDQAVVFQYYELFDEFAIPSAYDWHYVSGEDCGELLLLLDDSSSDPPCSSIRIFGFDKASDSFIPARQELLTSEAISVKSLMLNSTTLFIATKNPNSPCSKSDLNKTTVSIYTWNMDSFKKLTSIPVVQPVDMVAFESGNKACLVVLEMESKVYCSLQNDLKWTLKEVLFTRGGQKASILQSRQTTLAIAAEDIEYMRENYAEGQRHVDIYRWNSSTNEFLAPRQVIESTFTQSLALMNHTDEVSEALFLVIAEGSIPRIHNKPKIVIYRYDDYSDGFQKFQEIQNYGVLEWLSLKTGELLLFVANPQEGQVYVYQYKGVSGFMKMDTIKSFGTTTARPFIRPDPEDWLNHYVALAGPHAAMAQPMQGTAYTKILKSKMKGKRPVY